jgi:hypothetical protein
MNNQEKNVLHEVHLKIRKQIVNELQREFKLEAKQGFQVGFGDRMDVWLPISSDFKHQWSAQKATLTMERVFKIRFQEKFQVRWPQRGDWPGLDDLWFPIPTNFSLDGWSDEEIQTIAGKLVMLRWDFVPASFEQQEIAQEMLMLMFSIHPGMIFEEKY